MSQSIAQQKVREQVYNLDKLLMLCKTYPTFPEEFELEQFTYVCMQVTYELEKECGMPDRRSAFHSAILSTESNADFISIPCEVVY